jgi:hypothetical protein
VPPDPNFSFGFGTVCKCVGGTCSTNGVCQDADGSLVSIDWPGCQIPTCTADCDCPDGLQCFGGYCGTWSPDPPPPPPSGICGPGGDCPCIGGECRGRCCYLPDGTPGDRGHAGLRRPVVGWWHVAA